MFTKKKFTEMFDEGHERVGWLGMLAILSAYALVSTGVLSPTSIEYQTINMFGSGALLYTAFKTHAFPVVALNIAWLIIAVSTIITLY